MTPEMLLALGILSAAIILFVTEWLRVDVVAIGVMVSLMLTGLLTTQEAISGFSNPAVLTIASLFIVGGAVMQTGLAAAIGQRILDIAGSNPERLTVVIMVAVALLSGFMSDTGTVAVLLPAIVSLAASARISTSKLLIPLAYGSLLGGATTLIGTPPNIIVSDLLREHGLTPFRFFDYTPIGVSLFISGTLFMLLVGRRILPDHKPRQDVQRVETPEELVDLYRLPENLFRLRVRRESDLVGKTIADARLRQDFNLTILDVLRPPEPNRLARVRDPLRGQNNRSSTTSVTADTRFDRGDILIAKGEPNDISHAAAYWNLGLQPAQLADDYSLISQEAGIAEVLLPPRSSLLGKTLVDVRFGTLYGLTVLAIHRPESEGPLDLKETELRFGDTLLVQGPWERILALRKKPRDFVVMGQPEEMVGAPARRKAPLALLILTGMLALMIANVITVAAATMLAALTMILTGCVTIDEAYEAVDWKSVVLIAGMLPMSIALEKVGLVSLVAQGLAQYLGELGPLFVLAGLFAITSFFTQIISNTATTVLVAPIGLAAALHLGIQPFAFLMAIAIAASMAFSTPVASPVNTLVMGAGNYRFTDYIKTGVPMILIAMIVTVIILPLLFPF
jgi:di/tricarboxylate transporter